MHTYKDGPRPLIGAQQAGFLTPEELFEALPKAYFAIYQKHSGADIAEIANRTKQLMVQTEQAITDGDVDAPEVGELWITSA